MKKNPIFVKNAPNREGEVVDIYIELFKKKKKKKLH